MPFYDYKCAACGQITEIQHGMNERPKGVKCEACGKGILRRVFQVFARLGGASTSSAGSSCSSCSSGSCSSCR